MADVLALVVAAGFALMGAALVRPAFVLAQFGIEVETAEGRNEVSAVYGGFGLAVAAVLAATTLADSSAREGVALTLAVALAGMAAGRLIAAARASDRAAPTRSGSTSRSNWSLPPRCCPRPAERLAPSRSRGSLKAQRAPDHHDPSASTAPRQGARHRGVSANAGAARLRRPAARPPRARGHRARAP